MPWVKIEGEWLSNARVGGLLDDGLKDEFILYVAAFTYATRDLTDGIIKTKRFPMVAALARLSLKRARFASKKLVERGLLEEINEGLYVHDYREYNPSAEEEIARRKKTSKERAEAGRKGGLARAEAILAI